MSLEPLARPLVKLTKFLVEMDMVVKLDHLKNHEFL
jgi:hypothetical protein